MNKDEMKSKISMALKDPILQQGFEIICKENAELKKELNATVEVDNFCENRWNECAPGIHFFINRQEAINYN